MAEFNGYRWSGLHTASEGTEYQQRASKLDRRIDWDALCAYASTLQHSERCDLDAQMTMGGRHLVRILIFESGLRWIARVRTTPTDTPDQLREACFLLQCEVDCMQLVRSRTAVPVPKIFAHMANTDNSVGSPFMLMECLPGNVATDLDFNSIPAPYKRPFYADMARMQTELSSILFPKIGSVIRSPDGSYDMGPLPGIGGPFDTATDFLRAWGETASYCDYSESRIAEACGEHAETVLASIAAFPGRIAELAARIACRNTGPFPLCHPDFGPNNTVVNDRYDILGVIDWEHTYAMPWEVIGFPLSLRLIPKPMDAPWTHDENGDPLDEGARVRIRDQQDYITSVRNTEQSQGLPPTLSAVLENTIGQQIATAMRLYTDDGKMGWYIKILDQLSEEDTAQ